jgi:hypothetical protein
VGEARDRGTGFCSTASDASEALSNKMIQEATRTVKLRVDGQQAASIELGDSPFGIGRDKSNGLVLQDNKV